MRIHWILISLIATSALAETPPLPPARDARVSEVAAAVSAERLRADVTTLAAFGTRHTLSDTVSETRGIGAARRWVEAEMRRISAACGGRLEVRIDSSWVEGEARIPERTEIVNVVGILPGERQPNRWIVIAGDIDSRATDVLDGVSDAPGANDNATGLAAVLEAARVLCPHRYGATLVFAALSGEEQGLFGGRDLAARAKADGIQVDAVLNNDMIGNIAGIAGTIDNTTARVFSESPAANTTLEELRRMRVFGGEVDSPSRQLARYVDRIADDYLPNLDARMIYRLDRFGRGGHHRPFNDAGFPAVRIMETHEHYDRQHQDLRNEDGRHFGDTLEFVDFDYAAKLTALNVATLAALASAPPAPTAVEIAGAVEPAARLRWQPVDDPTLAGYKVWWRDTTSPTWDRWEWVGTAATHTTTGRVIDNYTFGVSAVGKDVSESVVVFPTPARF
jgi:hypothetical protein